MLCSALITLSWNAFDFRDLFSRDDVSLGRNMPLLSLPRDTTAYRFRLLLVQRALMARLPPALDPITTTWLDLLDSSSIFRTTADVRSSIFRAEYQLTENRSSRLPLNRHQVSMIISSNELLPSPRITNGVFLVLHNLYSKIIDTIWIRPRPTEPCSKPYGLSHHSYRSSQQQQGRHAPYFHLQLKLQA